MCTLKFFWRVDIYKSISEDVDLLVKKKNQVKYTKNLSY